MISSMCSTMRSPMPGKLFELSRLFGKLLDRFMHAGNQLGGFFVGSVAADDRAVDFQELGGFAENACEGLVVHAGDYKARRAQRTLGRMERSVGGNRRTLRKRREGHNIRPARCALATVQ